MKYPDKRMGLAENQREIGSAFPCSSEYQMEPEGPVREEEAKTIVSIVHETMINLEEVGTYESEVIFIQKFPL